MQGKVKQVKKQTLIFFSIYVKFLFILQSRCNEEKTVYFSCFSSRFTLSGKYSEDFKICFSLLEVKKTLFFSSIQTTEEVSAYNFREYLATLANPVV
jgi:hypothetical protein